ncbi:MAG: hypothetical protein P4L69_05140, partial [Desulfosporosinus sp.]|nr:hypothetical protein [Desulfosporosinus sp.]
AKKAHMGDTVTLHNISDATKQTTLAVDTTGVLIVTPSAALSTNVGSSTATSRFTAAGVRVEDSTSAATFKVEGYMSTNSDYNVGSVSPIPTTLTNAAIVNGKIQLTAGTATWTLGTGAIAATVGTFKFKYTPGYSGAPTPAVYLLSTQGATLIDQVLLSHHITGDLVLWTLDHSGNPGSGALILKANWNQTSGQEYEFELDWSTVSPGTYNLYIDGVQVGSAVDQIPIATRSAATQLTITSGSYGSTVASWRDIEVFTTALHSGTSYTRGYAAIPSVDAPFVRASNQAEVHCLTDWSKGVALSTDSTGTLLVTSIPSSLSVPQVLRTVGTAAATSRFEGAGIRIQDSTSTASFKVEGYVWTSADYSAGGGSLTAQSLSNATIVNGKIQITNGHATWVLATGAIGATTGTFKFRFTPGYGPSAPATDVYLIDSYVGGFVDIVRLIHHTDGSIQLTTNDNSGNPGTTGVPILASWAPISGTEYEFELDWSTGSPGSYKLYINGINVGSLADTIPITTRTAAIRLNISTGAGVTANWGDIEVFTTVLHTGASYTRGYAGLAAVDAPIVRTSTGMFYPTAGGVPYLLDFYESYSFNLAIGLGLAGSNLTGRLIRLGRLVTMGMDSVFGTITGNEAIVTTDAIPVRYRPLNSDGNVIPVLVRNATVQVLGTMGVPVGGIISFGSTAGGAVFTSGQNGGVYGQCVTWIV